MRLLATAMACPKGAVDANRRAHIDLLHRAAQHGCALVVCPEMSLTGYPDPATHPEQLIGIDHDAVRAVVRETKSTGWRLACQSC